MCERKRGRVGQSERECTCLSSAFLSSLGPLGPGACTDMSCSWRCWSGIACVCVWLGLYRRGVGATRSTQCARVWGGGRAVYVRVHEHACACVSVRVRACVRVEARVRVAEGKAGRFSLQVPEHGNRTGVDSDWGCTGSCIGVTLERRQCWSAVRALALTRTEGGCAGRGCRWRCSGWAAACCPPLSALTFPTAASRSVRQHRAEGAAGAGWGAAHPGSVSVSPDCRVVRSRGRLRRLRLKGWQRPGAVAIHPCGLRNGLFPGSGLGSS